MQLKTLEKPFKWLVWPIMGTQELRMPMLGVLMRQSQRQATPSVDMVDSVSFGALAMKIIGLGIDRLRLKLRIMSDDDLWWVFLNHREECSPEFWEELENRKAAGILSKDSPFWTMGELARYRHPRGSGDSNLIELTREEWEARRRRKMLRVISA